MADGEAKDTPDGAEQEHDARTVVDGLADGPQESLTRPPVRAARPGDTRFMRALRDLNVAEMITLAPPGHDANGGGEGGATNGPVEDKYVARRELGRGGMGVVHRVDDVHLRRPVAMKTLLDGAEADPQLAALLVREARLTGQLEHPNIIPIYDLGTLASGSFFYTMRLHRELTLATILDGLQRGDPDVTAHWTEERLFQIFRGICMAVAFAHSRGVVHRDLKPNNVLVGEYGQVQLTDWGVAQVTETATVSVAPLPQGEEAGAPGTPKAAGLVGTPQYMAPEQVRIDPPIHPCTDLYSLGVLLYEILTLRLPYPDDHSDDLEALLRDVMEANTLPVEDRNPERPVAPEMAAICHRALSRQPEDRFATADALWDAIAGHLRGTRRRQRQTDRARAEVRRGEAAALRYFEILDERRRLDEHIAALQTELKPWHPMSRKQELWDLRDKLDHMAIYLGHAFSETTEHYRRALVHEPSNRAARSALARLYWSKLEHALARRDSQDIVVYGSLVEQLSDRREGPLRGGRGTLSVRTLPEGAAVWLYGIAELSPGALDRRGGPAGLAPLMDLNADAGVYILVARAGGYRETRRPVLIHAGETHEVLLTLPPLEEERPMVGRDGELGRVKALFESACENRRPVFCLLRAEAGMGRTKLIDAFEAVLHTTSTAALFHAEPRRTHPQLPFAPLADLFAFRAGIKREDSRDVRRRKLVELVRAAFSQNERRVLNATDRLQVEETAEDLGLLPGLVDLPMGGRATVWTLAEELDPEEILRRIFAGVTLYFERLGDWRPVYLRIRSADRLDRSTVDLLRHLRRRLAGTPFFALGDLARTDRDTAAVLLFEEEVALHAFDRLTVERFLAHYLDGAVTRRLAERFHVLSGGRPAHLEVLAPLLAETGHIAALGSTWDLTEAEELTPEAVGFARAVEQLVIRPLSAEERRLLHRAAVAGRVFSREELVALGVEEPDSLTASLMERQVIRARPTAGLLWTEVFAFASETLWKIAYREMEPGERRALHARLASYLASLPDPPPEGVALMADHFRRAGQVVDAAAGWSALAAHARTFAARHEEKLNQELATTLLADGSPAPEEDEEE